MAKTIPKVQPRVDGRDPALYIGPAVSPSSRRVSVFRRFASIVATSLFLMALAGVAIWIFPDQARLFSPPAPFSKAQERANPPVQRITIEKGQTVVKLSAAEQRQIGLETSVLQAGPYREEFRAYGTVLDLARVTELTNSYANANAQLQTAQTKLEVSKSTFQRAKSLGQYATAVQVEAAEGTFRTDQASLAAAESQLKTLAATAQQEWGPVIGKAIVERSPTIINLIERDQFLVQVTLPPGVTLAQPPLIALAQAPNQDARVEVQYISPAARTDPRIQGLSYFYSASGSSGVLPGMNTLVFMPSGKVFTGVIAEDSAVVRWQGRSWVYLRTGPDTFARHPISIDQPVSDDDYIVQDIPPQAEVVVRGAQALLSEEAKTQLQGSAGVDDD